MAQVDLHKLCKELSITKDILIASLQTQIDEFKEDKNRLQDKL